MLTAIFSSMLPCFSVPVLLGLGLLLCSDHSRRVIRPVHLLFMMWEILLKANEE